MASLSSYCCLPFWFRRKRHSSITGFTWTSTSHVADEHETQAGARNADEPDETLQPTGTFVGTNSAQHCDSRHAVVRNDERGGTHPRGFRVCALARLERPSTRRRMGDHGDRMSRKVAVQRRCGPTRRRDQKCRSRDQCAMLRTPVQYVDVREGGLRVKTGPTNRRIRFLAAVAPVHAEEEDSRTCEAQIMHGVAVWHAKRCQCCDDTVATAGNVVEMNEIDAESLADPPNEISPCRASTGGAFRPPRGSALTRRCISSGMTRHRPRGPRP